MANKQKKNAQPATPAALVTDDAITFENLSLDLGNAFSNIRGDNGFTDDFRSVLAPLSNANSIDDPESNIRDVFTINGKTYVGGEKVYTLAPDAVEDNPTVNRYVSDWYKRLFAYALHRAFRKRVGRGIVYPRIISSVPAQLFKNGAEVDTIKANLCGDYQIGNVMGGELIVSVLPQKTIIIPEGVGTFFGYVFGAGRNPQFERGTYMIADSGYLTLDCVVLRDGEYMPDRAYSDALTGISRVAEAVKARVFSEARVDLSAAELDTALSCDTVTANGKIVQIAETKQKVLTELGARASLMLERWASGLNLSGVVFTGGGAPYLHPYIQTDKIPAPIMPTNTRRSNVEGAYLYLTDES